MAVRAVGRMAAAAVAVALWAGAALALDRPTTLVEICRPDWEAVAKRLASEQFDVAGADRDRGAIQVVATAPELARLDAQGIAYTVLSTSHPLDRGDALSDYTDPAEMAVYLDTVVAAHPGLAQKVLVEDTLFEGQQIWALKITKDPDLPNDRPRFLLDASHHAREVMGPEVAKDCIEYLTSRYATDAQVRGWVDGLEIWVVPHVNPDGAAYVFSTDNNWRRNRNPGCPVDNNRNYPVLWNACGGSSGLCADITYRGPSPASEPETQAFLALTESLRPLFALSYHSYGQYILYSYGCSDPDEKSVIDPVAQGLNAILVKDNGSAGGWATGPIWSTIYSADGGSVDTQYGQSGAYAFVIELNTTGFQPDYATYRNVTVQRQRTAWQYFLDKTLSGPQVRGRVTDASTGSPVTATVSAQEVTFTHGESPRKTDSRGIYHWLASAGSTLHLTFAAPGYCTETRTVAVGSGAATQDVALTAPAIPAGVAAAPDGDNRIALSWSAAPGAAGYKVLRSLTSGGPYTLVQSPPAGQTSWTDTTVSGAVTYYYVLRSTQACGDSPDSVEVSAATTGNCTQAPLFAGVASVVPAPGATCALDVSWPAAAPYCGGPTTYRLYRSTTTPFTPGPSNLVAAGLAGTTYRDGGALANGSTYSYLVRAADAGTGTEDDNLVVRGARPLGPLTDTTWTDDGGDTGTAKLSVQSPWAARASGGVSGGPRVYSTGTTTDSLCAALTTPDLMLGSGAVLTFQSKYDLEANFDAGEVEVAAAPAFDTWVRLATVNYPDPLAYSGNACNFDTGGAGTAFSRRNSAPTYAAYTASLSAYAGQTVRLRWRVSTDSGVNYSGWWVDSIQVTHVMVAGTCAAGPAPLPAEAGAGGSLRATRLAGDQVQVDYTPACGALDHVAYRGAGPIAGALAWTGSQCALGTTGRATLTLADPAPGGWSYFVVVGRDGSREGSYGTAFSGTGSTQRPEAQGVGACDLPQVLGGSCP